MADLISQLTVLASVAASQCGHMLLTSLRACGSLSYLTRLMLDFIHSFSERHGFHEPLEFSFFFRHPDDCDR